MIWGGATEWTITSSGTWTVPKTGRYYIELYGGGGGAINPNDNPTKHQGGSSCQAYDSIELTAKTQISATIGTGGKTVVTRGGSSTAKATGTTFGSYSVAGGGQSDGTTNGAGAGNKGTNGTNTGDYNYSKGSQSKKYGYGGFYDRGGSMSYADGGPGAVYLKYLGA